MAAEPTSEPLLEGEREAREQARARRARRLADIPSGAIVWMAVAPLWTVPLAAACAFVSASGQDDDALQDPPDVVEHLLDRMAEEGLCVRMFTPAEPAVSGTTFLPTETLTTYAMAAEERRRLLSGIGLPETRRQARRVGTRMRAAAERGLTLPPMLDRWSRLAERAEDTGAMAQLLEDEVGRLLAAERAGDALAWIRTARGPAEFLGGTFKAAADRVARRLELRQRQDDDERHLQRFLDREELDASFRALLDRDPETDGRWALHYVGDGGVGKTMLLRHLSRGLPDRPATTARIDFDFLSPDYPSRQPALLLAELAEELRLHADEETLGLFASFDAGVRRLDERAATPLAGSAAEQRRADEEFDDVFELFVAAVKRLKPPVVLLIDTCEELSKLRADGTVPDSVSFTFARFDRLQRRVPGLSVVFCGRRPLGSSNHDWRLKERRGEGRSRLPARDFLRLHEIGGFTEEEARRYLTDKAEVREELHDVILERSWDRGAESRFEWSGAPPEAPAARRYLPFKLNALGAWARAVPKLEPDDISRSEDRYVEMRIVERIAHPVLRSLLAPIGLLQRFDRALLAMAWDGDEESADFKAAVDELAELEWVSRDAQGFFSVERTLREGLERWCAEHQALDVALARRQLVAALEERTLRGALARQRIEYFEAVPGLLGGDTARTLAWWSAVEARLTAEGAIAWLSDLTARLLGEEDGIKGLARAAVLATAAAARLQVDPGPPVADDFARALVIARRAEDGREARRLRVRARAGLITATRYGGPPAGAADIAELKALCDELEDGEVDEALAGALVAAAEAVLEESGDRPCAARVVELLEGLDADLLSPELSAFLLVLRERARRAAGAAPQPMPSADGVPSPGPTPARWLDWRSPDDVGSRVRLELALDPWREPHHAVRELDLDAPLVTGTAESRWLCSALLQRLGAVAPVDRDRLWALREAAAAAGIDRPRCRAHAAAGPLFVAVAAELADQGRADEAIDLLHAHATRADEVEDAAHVVRDADRAYLRIARRLRLGDEGPLRTLRAGDSPELPDFAALAALDGLAGRKRIEPPTWDVIPADPVDAADWPAWRHARWRGLFAVPDDLATRAVEWAAAALAHERLHAPDGPAARACLVDLAEAAALAERVGMPPPAARALLPRTAPASAADPPVERLRLALRCAAVGGASVERETATLARTVGLRAAAQIALDEGELLALRLPEPARALLETSAQWHRAAGDAPGTFIAATAAAATAARLERTGWVHESLEMAAAAAADAGVELPAADADAPPALEPGPWRPWVVRYAAAAAWLADRDGGRRAPALRHWVEDHYGAPAPGAPAVPAELDGWLQGKPTLRPSALAVPAPRPGGKLSRIAGQVAALLGLLVAGVGLWRVLVTSSSGIADSLSTIAAVVGVVLGVAGYAVVLVYAVRWWVHRVLTAVPAVIEVIPAGQAARKTRAGARVEAVLVLTRRPTLAFRRPKPVSALTVSDAADADELEPIAAPLVRLRGQVGDRRVRLRLYVDRGIAAPAWEATVATALDEPVGPDATFVISRGGERERAVSAPPRRRSRFAPGTMVTLSGGPSEDEMARRGWAGAAYRLGDLAAGGVGGLHVIGTPLETTSGVRLELSRVIRHQRDLAVSRRTTAEALYGLAPGQWLTVLQATPVERSRHAADERDQAACLRVLAADLYSLGVAAVVTIPPVSHDLGAAILAAIAGPLGELRDIHRLERGVAAARGAVMASPDVDDKVRRDVAFEICLYAGST